MADENATAKEEAERKKEWDDLVSEVYGGEKEPDQKPQGTDESLELGEFKETEDASGNETAGEKQIEDEPDDKDEVKEQVDPWAGVPDVIKEQFVNLEKRLSQSSTLEERLKQAERRIGSLTNELSEAKKAKAQVQANSETPTNAEIKNASKDSESWDNLKKDFPEWAEALDDRISNENRALKESLDALNAKISGMETIAEKTPKSDIVGRDEIQGQIERLKEEFSLTLAHPNWKSDIETTEFRAFMMTAPDDLKAKADSVKAVDAIAVLDAYAEYQGIREKTPQQIKEERSKRLKQSRATNQQKHRPVTSKPVEEMTDSEVWSHMAKQVWQK